MKTKLFFALLFIPLGTLKTAAQCTQNAFGFGNNTNVPSYNINGNVSVTLNTNNTVTLNLASNFMTANGPDVRAYLVKSNGATNTTLSQSAISSLERIEFGLVACSGCSPAISPNGQKSFTVAIPNGVTISQYDKVFFYCFQFNAFWDVGSFTPFTSVNCALLSNEDNFLSNFVIYQNPVSKTIKISGSNLNSAQIRIFDSLGKTVHQQNKNLNQEINISHLNSGLYILKIDVQGKTKTQKLVIRQ